MHLLAATPGGFVDDTALIDLGQSPAEIVILSAADTTLSLLAKALPADYPSLRLANLLHLRQAASVDLYLDQVLRHAKLIIVDHLGGESYWPYGTEQLVLLSQQANIDLVMFSGDHQEDINLLRKSSLAPSLCRQLWRYLREGGSDNARQFYHCIAVEIFAWDLPVLAPKPLPNVAVFHPRHGLASPADWQADWHPGGATLAIVFYRSHLQAGNTAVFAALCETLLAQGMNPLPIALNSLKDSVCLHTLQQLCREQQVSLVLNTTAFAVSNIDAPELEPLLDDVPVLQLILSSSNLDSWQTDSQGLQPRDIAMHIALPEVDGRIITRAISFKGLAWRCERTQADLVQYQPQADRLAFIAELSRRWIRLRQLPNADKRLAVILANYPSSEARIGNGVGLDTPQSVITLLQYLQQQGYDISALPDDGDQLIHSLLQGVTNAHDSWSLRPAMQSLALNDYLTFFDSLPKANQVALLERWGPPEQDPMLRQNRFMIAGLRLGQVFVGIQPARGYALDLAANYHDPDLVPPHHYLAFYYWLRETFACDAIIHAGKHGNLEWLPGKSVALSQHCWPELILGPMPHIYPFIVNDPGEGSQAKRRSQAVIIDHLMPPLTRAETYGPLADLERQVDEFYEALSLDPKRAQYLRKQLLQQLLAANLHRDLGIAVPQTPAEEQTLLNRLDAYLCELKESQIRDGLHIFGCSPQGQQRIDTLLALARFPQRDQRGKAQSLFTALAEDFGFEAGFDPLQLAWEAPWQGPKPAELLAVSDSPWRNHGDTRERLELFAQQLLRQQHTPADLADHLPRTALELDRLQQQLLPRLDACGPQELLQLERALAGKFVPPGPSGAPSRGRLDVLPTGRNFYSVDTRAIPTQTSWQLGAKSASALLARYLQEHGNYPKAIGLSVWGTATMRTGGDDIAQAFALLGVRPVWAAGSHRVVDFEILPMSVLDRPRIDVTLRISGFFRDAFSNVIQLFDAAVQAVAELDEPADINPIRQRIQTETAAAMAGGLSAELARAQAGYRVFGAKPGAYGAGMQGLIETGHWQDDADLASAYQRWGGYAYGQQHSGTAAMAEFAQRLSQIELVMHNQDNREHDLLDSDDYYQFQGGMSAAIRHFRGQQPSIYHGDHSNPEMPRIRSLEEEISRVIRARVVNPKWLQGIQRHGYKGGAEIAATVDYLFAYDATARVIRDDQYAAVTEAYVQNPDIREFLHKHNPQALHAVCERLLEAIQRGLWQQPGDLKQQLENHLLQCETHLEAGSS